MNKAMKMCNKKFKEKGNSGVVKASEFSYYQRTGNLVARRMKEKMSHTLHICLSFYLPSIYLSQISFLSEIIITEREKEKKKRKKEYQ